MSSLEDQNSLAVDACLDAYRLCGQTALRQMVRYNAANDDCRDFLLSCAEFCRVTAQAIVLGTGNRDALCANCADLCAHGARICECYKGMNACLVALRICADRCRGLVLASAA